MSLRKSDLIQLLSLRAGIDEGLAREAINLLIEAITQSLVQGTPVALSGFGRFEVNEYPTTPVKPTPAFIPGTKLRTALRHVAAGRGHRKTLKTIRSVAGRQAASCGGPSVKDIAKSNIPTTDIPTSDEP